MSQTYNKYVVSLTDIEWDADPKEYSPELVRNLPKTCSIRVNAPDAECAKEWGMSDFSENHGFCIQGCKVTVAQC